MTFVSTDPQNHQSENTWFTPHELIRGIGDFDLDPCTMSFRPFDTAKIHFEFDKGICGLSKKWDGDVWLNPPYGREMTPFIEKFCQHQKGVMLIFARMGSRNIQYLVKQGAVFFFLRKRIKFIKRDWTVDTNAGTDSALVFFDKKWVENITKLEGVLMRAV